MKLWFSMTCVLLLMLASAGCGYHVAGKGSQLPPTLRTISVLSFENQTKTYHVETRLTEAVVREFNTRTHYRIINTQADSDAVLRGVVTSAQVAPATYDSRTGQVSTSLVTVAIKVTLTDRNGRVLYENPNFIFREQYQVARESANFFEEQGPALDRLSRDFARTLVSNILEAF